VNRTEAIRFPVVGMTCASCVSRIARSLRKVDGVTRVTVDLRHETATVTRTAGLAPDAALAAAVERAGYAADLTAQERVAEAVGERWLARLVARCVR
jgi:Cu+-exporting ATPase